MRFSDEEYLRAWKEDGVFPQIHNDIFSLFASTFEAESVLDLCCCTGLLGQRVQETFGISVVGLEGQEKWITRGKTYGITVEIQNLLVKRETLGAVTAWVEKNEVTGILARRCLSELFGNSGIDSPATKADFEFASMFARAMAKAGVTEFWIEGRANQGRSVHPIPDTDTEIKCLSSAFSLSERYRNCAYLTAL